MSRNYAVGSRNLKRAGVMFLNRSSLSFSSKATLSMRWGKFCEYAKSKHINKLETITYDLVINYGQHLQRRINEDSLSPATAQNYVSSVNTVMSLTPSNWKPVSPTANCLLDKRTRIASYSKSTSEKSHLIVTSEASNNVKNLMDFQRYLGLRFKESCLLDAKQALREAIDHKLINVIKGTKGGRRRQVPASKKAIEVLKHAVEIQDGKSLIPKNLSYKEFRNKCYQEIKDKDFNFHGERHWYAQNRYQELTKAPPAIVANWSRKERINKLAEFLNIEIPEAKKVDQKARLQIAYELGHSREEITNTYLG